MDEAQKYKQRLEAIAEKRRLQEEQDKARREMEDEKLRQQQLKRKSLRDQWLMEGPPLSPISPTTQNLLSSLWDTQDMEKPSDTLQAENQRLTEGLETLEEQKGVKVTDPAAENVPTPLQNGENKAAASETSDDVELDRSPPQVEKAAVLTNGGGDLDPNSNHIASEQSELNPNGPVRVTEGVNRINLEPEISVTKSASSPNANINEEEEEEEEGILVMRAEPVFITDDGDDGSEDLLTQEDQGESDQTPLPHPEAGYEMGEGIELVVETEPAPETVPEPENPESTELTVEGQEPAGDEDEEEERGVKVNDNEDEETAEAQDEMEDQVCVQLQSPVSALEGAVVTLVPVYTETSPSALSHKPEAQTDDGASAAPEEEEETLNVEDPFQEVPLTDSQENKSTKMEPGEQEPLLVKVKASNVYVESAGSNSPVNTETQNQTKPSQGEDTGSPKHKTCQCCSVM